MTATVQADLRPTSCGCRCGCAYRLESEASVSEGRCFSCRVGLHAGRREGWRPTDPMPSEDGPQDA